MADNVIDTLELQVESNANNVEKSLDKLAKTLTGIKTQINGINYKNMSKFANSANIASKHFGKLLKTAESLNKRIQSSGKGIVIPIKADADNFEDAVEKLQERFKNVGLDFSFSGSDLEVQKMIKSTEKSLDRLYAKRDEMQDLGVFGGKSFVRLERNIAMLTNRLDILREKFAENKKAAEEMAKSITITRFDSAGESTYEPPKNAKVSEKSLGYNSDAMEHVFGKSAAHIKDFSDAVDKLGQHASITLNNLKLGISDAGEAAKNMSAKVTNAAKNLRENLQGAGLSAEKLEGDLKNIKISPVDTSGLDNAQSELSQTEGRIQSLISKIRDMASVGKINVGGAGFEKLKESINSITGKMDSLKKRMTDALKLRFDIGKWSKFLNITTLINKLFSKIKGGAKGVVSSVRKMGDAFSSLHSAVKRVEKMIGALFRGMMGLSSKAASAITNSAKGIASAFSRVTSASSGLKGASLNLGTLVKAAVGMKAASGIVNFGKSAIELGSDITEVENVVDTAFGSMADSAYKFAETATEKFGLSELAAKQYSSTMMSMMKSSGMAQKQAAKMATTLTGLAGDMAAFYGIESGEMFEKLQSAMSGESDALRSLGINMSVANLESYALSQGIRKSYSEMSVAEQTMLRYNYILARTAGIQGSAAKAAGTYAGQMRILKANLQSLSAIIGQGLIAALLPAIKLLNKFMEKLMQAAKVFRDFMYVLTGKKLEGSTKEVVNDLAGVGDEVDLSGISNESGDVADNMEDAADGMDDATSSAKKLKKSLSVLPIDELNQLAGAMEDLSTSSDGAGKGTNLADKALGLDDAGLGDMGNLFDSLENPDVTPINKWAKAIREAFLKHDWEGVGKNVALMLNAGLKKIYTGIKNITPKVVQGLKNFAEGVNGFVQYFDWPLLGRTIGAGINLISKSFNALTDPETGIDFVELGKGIARGVRGLLDEVDWTELGNAIGNGFMVAWRLAKGIIDGMWAEDDLTGLNGWQELGRKLGEGVNGIFEKIDFALMASVITEGFRGILVSVTELIAEIRFDKIVENINEGLQVLYDGIKWDTIGAEITAFTTEVKKAFNDLMELDFGLVGSIIGAGITDIIRAFNQLTGEEGLDFETLGANISDGFRRMIEEIPWTEFGNALGNFFMIGWRILDGFITDMSAENDAGLTGWEQLGIALGGAVNGLFDKVDFGVLFGILVDGFNGIIDSLKAFIDEVEWEDIAHNISNGLNTMIQGVDMENLGETFSDLIKSLLDVIVIVIEETDWEGLGEKIFDFLASIDWAGIVSRLAEIIGAAFGGFGAILWGFIKDAWQMVIDWWSEKAFSDGKFTITGLLNGILEGIADIGIWIWDHIAKPFLDGFKKAFGIHSPSTVMAELGGFIMDGLLNGISSKLGALSDKLSEIKGKILDSWDKIKTGAERVTKTIKEKWGGLKDKLKEIGEFIAGSFSEKWKGAWKGIKNAFKDAWDGLADVVKKPINAVIDVLNGLISKVASAVNFVGDMINGLGIDVPENVPVIGGLSFHPNLPTWNPGKIPYLATGGLITAPTLAVTGERYRKEAVLPLENPRTMSMIASSIMAEAPTAGIDEDILTNAVSKGVAMAMMNNPQAQTSPEYIQNSIYLDGSVLARVLSKAQREIDYRMNPTPQFG